MTNWPGQRRQPRGRCSRRRRSERCGSWARFGRGDRRAGSDHLADFAVAGSNGPRDSQETRTRTKPTSRMQPPPPARQHRKQRRRAARPPTQPTRRCFRSLGPHVPRAPSLSTRRTAVSEAAKTNIRTSGTAASNSRPVKKGTSHPAVSSRAATMTREIPAVSAVYCFKRLRPSTGSSCSSRPLGRRPFQCFARRTEVSS